jgi:hypothetical protein
MGKAALILVAAVTVASGATYMSQDRQGLEAAMQEALYEHSVLAREVAKSGFNTVMSRVKADFDTYRVTDSDKSHRMGKMDMAASGAGGGPVTITVTGYYEEAEFEISGTLERSGGTLLDALTIDGPLKKFEVKNDADVSGLDTKPTGEDGSGSDVHAVRSILASAHAEVLDDLPPGFGVGVSGAQDVVQGSPTVNLSGLVTSITTYDGEYLDEYTGKVKFEDEAIGSAAYPRVVRVQGDVELKGTTTGYGVLYVLGNLKMKDDARWEGLVVTSEDKGKVELKNDARIYGAMVSSAVSEDGPGGDSAGGGGLPGGHFDVDVFDARDGSPDKIYHEHQYDDDYDVTGVNLLTPTGCKTDGGLCWDDVLTGEDDVYVEFVNHTNSKGSYRIKDGVQDLTGDPMDGLAMTAIDLSSIEYFWVDFDALCYLQESSPGDVQGDDVYRNGAFSIRIYEADGDGGGDSGDDYSYAGPPENAKIAGFGGLSWARALMSGVSSLFLDGAKITICHIPPGNPDNPQTIEVSESAWSAHEAHGDTEGACASSDDGDEDGSSDEGGSDDESDGGGFTPGALIYELSVYHHTSEDFACGTVASDEDDEEDSSSSYGKPIEIKLDDDSLIQYSAESLSNALDLFGGYALGSGEITLTNVNESGVRSRKHIRKGHGPDGQ